MSKKNQNAQSAPTGLKLSRQKIDIREGNLVGCDGVVYRISDVIDFESILAINVETGRKCPLCIGDLMPMESLETGDPPRPEVDIDEIADADWKIAEQRFAAIEPLIKHPNLKRHDVDSRAKALGIHPTTLYRWITLYTAFRSLSTLIPKKRGWKTNGSRLSKSADAIVEEVINNYYLTIQRPTVKETIKEINHRCDLCGTKPPAASTIQSRIEKIPEKERLMKRGYKEKAKNKFLPAARKFPNANFPLQVVQIDHTPVDIILVDDFYRKPIGRPWITLAMDVNSRMVTGYYLSFDSPSETSVAMCVAHAMLPKDEWLMLHKVDAKWPVWGIPVTIHVDNGPDFRSDNFQRSCQMYGINLEFRPVKQPRFGGHIERLLGTLLKEIHALPGTTFSSIKEKDEYNPEKHATMTKSEFEEWLVTLICKVYHQRLHSTIGMSPLRKWEIGIFGNAEVQGIGMPERLTNRHTVHLDFLPSFRRSVQPTGVRIEGMKYYAEALRSWISAADPESPDKKHEMVFRRDPRDISVVWFFDPVVKEYYKVPFADQSLPSMSVWEFRQAKELLRKEGIKSATEHQINEAITELRSIVEAAKENTKKARRQSQRRKEHEKGITPGNPLAAETVKLATHPPEFFSGLVDGDVEAFGDIS
ncbi:putative transposase [Methylomagnum ishizawai]|uniref:Putative transposase n=1 Tax=Methylomagnum ishizawai TaxID=1760988 RepID=A0A1Y6CXC4_9GAMM|nr:DDE-type integrase/transposase/recombinase [Methylomagnum ishizawai]SMF94997.1 putative transposase [Methylomagnum ishizawai]